jgi:hypothetical protein
MPSSQATDQIVDLSAAQKSARSTTLTSAASWPNQDESHDDETMLNPNRNVDSHQLSAPTSLVLSTTASSNYSDWSSQDVALFDSKRIRKEQPHNLFQTLIRRAIISGLAGGCITLCCLLLVHLVYPSALPHFSRVVCPRGACHDWQFEVSIRGAPSPTGVNSYLDHFGGTKHNSSSSSVLTKRNLTETYPRHHQRKLTSHDPELVIAGKMTVEDGPCNIAQLDLKTSKWSLPERIQLSLYNSYSGGEVYSLLANHTYQIPSHDDGNTDDAKK